MILHWEFTKEQVCVTTLHEAKEKSVHWFHIPINVAESIPQELSRNVEASSWLKALKWKSK